MSELHVLIDFFSQFFCNFVIVNYIIWGNFLHSFLAIDLSMMIGPLMEGHGNREYHEG